jgi:SAM-dependent methyltransferase
VSAVSDEARAWSAFYRGTLVSWPRHLRANLEYCKLLFQVLVRRPRRILEVGTGAATLSTFLSRVVPEVVTLDYSREILERARDLNEQLHGRLVPVHGDAFSLPFSRGRFDICFSAGFFEHFNDDDIGRLMREQLRVARRVVFSVPNAGYGHQDFGNERLLSSANWDDLLGGLGFKVRHSADYSPVGVAFWKRFPRVHYLAVVES